MWSPIIVFSLLCGFALALNYDAYEGVPTTPEKLEKFEKENTSKICVISFETCNKNETRRTDGSCNNLKYPSRGPFYTPYRKMLPSDFSDNFEPRKTKSGKALPTPRATRSVLLKVGESIGQDLAMSASLYPEFAAGDIVSIHDIENFVFNTTNCCDPEGRKNYWCASHDIPPTDHVHRFDNTRCFNQTRPQSFHNMGCVSKNTSPNRMAKATTFFDLSNMYEFAKGVMSRIRAYKGGRLKVETIDGRDFTSDAEETTTCFIKEARETGCVRIVPKGVLGSNLFITWYWRFHNLAADKLAEINPCWNDEKLFNVAMDITIAFHTQLLFYEFYALMIGKQRLIEAGILSANPGFRDIYDEEVVPGVSLEFPYIHRWFHLTQNANLKLYDKDGKFMKERSIVNYTLIVEELAFDDNMVGLTHGSYIQPSGRFEDHTVHPDMSEIGLGQFQHALDIPSGDLNNGKYLGLQPYIRYRDFCTKNTKKHTSFDDLRDIIPAHKLDELKDIYEDPADIELMAGCWAEKLMKGAWVPETVSCIIIEQLKRSITFDRHWYESSKRPNAFTHDQLLEMRKSTLATLLCAVGDDVTQIQKEAFRKISNTNPKVSCDKIPQINFSFWKDESCKSA